MINPDRCNVCRSSFLGKGLERLCRSCLRVGASSLFRPVEAAIFVQCMVPASVTDQGPGLRPMFDGSRFFQGTTTVPRSVFDDVRCFFGATGRFSAGISQWKIFASRYEPGLPRSGLPKPGSPRSGSPEPGRKSRSRSSSLIHLLPGANLMTPQPQSNLKTSSVPSHDSHWPSQRINTCFEPCQELPRASPGNSR
jgi:hypothetical protein